MTTHPAPLAEAAAALRDGTLRPTTYVDRLCDRVDEVEPTVHALLPEPDRRRRLRRDVGGGGGDGSGAANPETPPTSAATAGGERRAGAGSDEADRPALFGVPVGVKDIIHVEGFATLAGTAVPPSLFAGPEAPVVTRLRDAGAVVLGKTVTAEFAGSEPGPTRNPHDPGHTPGGSSSGSAAAVAAGECPLALGTQTGGSVIRPAAFCGVVGVLPGAGRVSTDGVVPRSASVDRVGLLTQDVAGAALAASVVCDGWTPVDRPGRPTLGVPTGPLLDRPSDGALAAFRDAVEALAGAGFDVVRTTAFADLDAVEERHRSLTRGELARVHGDWFDEYERLYRPRTADAVREGRTVTDDEVAEARAGRGTVREAVQARMDDAGIDVWVTPAAPGPAPGSIEGTGSSEMNRPWTYTGLPAVTVPAGTVEGLPVGLQCVSRLGADERLLAWADPIAAALSDAVDPADDG